MPRLPLYWYLITAQRFTIILVAAAQPLLLEHFVEIVLADPGHDSSVLMIIELLHYTRLCWR